MGHSRCIDVEIERRCSASGIDALIAELAGRQHGVVSRFQLRTAGIGPGAIDHRVRLGRLHVIHAGVYAVGHRVLTREGRWMAAVLAGGGGAFLSYYSAAALWGARPSSRVRIDITTPTARRARRGIRAHRSLLLSDEVTVRDGIPVTTVARTLLDLGGTLDVGRLTDAINEAEILRLFNLREVERLLERYPRRPGTASLRRAVAQLADEGVAVTRRELERRFKALIRTAVVPWPEFNAAIGVDGVPYVPDVLWREQKLIVELDGRATHGTQRAFEADRRRDRRLLAAGYGVIRVTWRQLHEEADAVVADIRAALAATRATSTLR